MARMSIPIICFDLDGTLIDEHGRIHPNDKAILSQPPRDVVLVPNTGRPMNSVLPMFHERDMLTGYSLLPFPGVCQNGGTVYLENEVLVSVSAVDPKVQAELIKITRPFKRVTTILTTVDLHMYFNPTEYGFQASRDFNFTLTPVSPDDTFPPLTKVMAFSDHPEDLAEIARLAEGLSTSASYSQPTIYEFLPAGVNKGTGLRALMDALDLQDSPVFAAGNGGNDVEMLEMADVAFAPHNSSADVLALADEVLDVSQEGLLIPMFRRAGLMVEVPR